MKAACTFYLAIILNIFSLMAQNYQTVNSGAPRFFIDTTGYIRAIKMDSAGVSGSDSLLYPFKTARDTLSISFSIGCIDGYGPSWIGHTVIIRTNGTNIFLNKENDSIYFNTQAQTGNSWTLYTFQNGDYVEATVLSVAYVQVLASSDSVKYISLQVKDFAGNNIIHPLNGKQFILSKDNGLVQLYDFYFFPDYNSFDANSNKFVLSNDHIPTIGEINDFDVGDEFETRSYICTPPGNPGRYVRYILLSKNVSPAADTICYHFFTREVAYWVDWNPTPHLDSLVTIGVIDTCVTNLNSPWINGMPEQSLGVTTGWHQFKMFRNNMYCGKIRIVNESGWNFWNTTDSCLVSNNFEPHYISSTMITGCYPSLFLNSYPAMMYCAETYLTYMKKDICIYGVPYLWTSANEVFVPNGIAIYPNPAFSELIIEMPFSNSFRIEIFNMTDKIVHTENFFGNQKQSIPVENLPNGVYFLKITSQQGTSFKKIIISH